MDATMAAILAVLADGPATTADVAARTGFTPTWTGIVLNRLMDAGRVSRSPIPLSSGVGRKYLWQIA